MSEIRIVYISLKAIEFLLFFISGKLLSKTGSDRQYWKIALLPIISYSLIEGLRFGRGIDWNLYFLRYQEIGKSYQNAEYEPLFEFIVHNCYQLGIPYYIFILFVNTLLIISSLLIFKKFKDSLYYILPIFLIVTLPAENYIRWYFSFSFFIYATYSLLYSNSFIKYILCGTCSFLIHYGILILLFVPLTYKYFNRKTLSPKLSLLLIFFSSFFLSIQAFDFLTEVSTLFSFISGADKYISNISGIINGEFGVYGIMNASFANNLIRFIGLIPIILWGAQIMKKYDYGIFLFNIFLVASIIYVPFKSVEIFDRYADGLIFFKTIVGGVVYYHLIKGETCFKDKQRLFILFCFSCVLLDYRHVFFITNDYRMLFMWSSGDKNYIDPALLIP